MLDQPAPPSLLTYFAALEDPRIERTQEHRLVDLVAIAICAVIGGADSWVDMAADGKAKQDWLRQFLLLPSGLPSHDTFARVLARLDPQPFQQCFLNWRSRAIRPACMKMCSGCLSKPTSRSLLRCPMEDQCRLRTAPAPQNFALLRQIALNLLTQEQTAKVGVQAKRKKAGWDDASLCKVLAQ